ncbi:MAG: glycosyltransferase family 4 protein [Vicinamibacterales bacterium]
MSRDGRARIAIEINPRIVGGTERFLASLLPVLDPARFEPIVVSAEEGPTHALFRARGVQAAVVPYAADDARGLAAALESLQVDLVQSSYFAPVLGLAAGQAGLPHIWRFGGHVAVVHERQTRREQQTFLSLATMLSRKIVCGSRFLARQFDLVGHGVDVIHNGLDLDEFSRASGLAADAETSRAPEPPRVAMVAHLVPQKRHEDFIRAAQIVRRRVPGVRFDVFGGCYPSDESREYARSLRTLVGALQLSDIVRFTHLDHGRLETLRGVDVFVLPSVNEGASNAILEAMALGKPVVASDSGGNPELVIDGETGFLVPPLSPSDLANRIARLLESPAVAAALGAAARRRVEDAFTIQMCAARYERLYQAVIDAA